MENMEELELNAHRSEIVADMRSLVEKYRAIFDWDIPDIDQQAADKLIVAEMHSALNDVAMRLDE